MPNLKCHNVTEAENRVLIDALTDKYNALSNSLSSHAVQCESRINSVESASHLRDTEITNLRADLAVETERRQNKDEALALSIEREAQLREAGDQQIVVDYATHQELSDARHALETALSSETSSREGTDANLAAEKADRMRRDAAIETRLTALEGKENSDFTSVSGRIDDLNDALANEKSARIAADGEVRAAALSAVEEMRTDIGSTLQRAVSSLTADLARESQTRLTEDARLSSQISTALRSSSDANNRITTLTQTVASNLDEAKAYSDSNLDTAKGYADGLKEELQDEIQTKVESVFVYRGQRESNQASDLPLTGNQVGDVYNVKRYYDEDGASFVEGANVVWNGEGWDKLSEDLDLTIFATKEELTAAEMGLRAETVANRDLINTINRRLGEEASGDVQTVEQRISDLQTRVARAEGDIANNHDDIDSANGRIDNMENDLSTKIGEDGGTVYGGTNIQFVLKNKNGPAILGGTVTSINYKGVEINGSGGYSRLSMESTGFHYYTRSMGESDGIDLEMPSESGTISTREYVDAKHDEQEDRITSWGDAVEDLRSMKADSVTVSALTTRMSKAEDAIGPMDMKITLNGHDFGTQIKNALQAVADEVTNLRTEFGGTTLGVEPALTRLATVEQSITNLQETVAGIPSDVSTVVSGAVTTAKSYTDAREEAIREGIVQEASLRAEGDAALGQRIDNLSAAIANDYAIADVDSVTMQLLNRTHNRFTYTGDGSSPLAVYLPQEISANRSRSFTLRLIVTNSVSGNLLRFLNYGGDGVPVIEYDKNNADALKVSQGVNVFAFTETAKDTYLVANIGTATYTNP